MKRAIDAGLDNMAAHFQLGLLRFESNRLANFFRDGMGIRKGDRVSIYAMNRVEYLDTMFACNKLGAILHRPPRN